MIFILGTIVASFLNAIVYRIEKQFPIKKMLFTRSECESCKKEVVWFELFPIISWIFLKGKCSQCGRKINIYYPISELMLGIGFVIVFNNSQNPLISLFFLSILFSLSYFDYLSKSIPQFLTNALVFLGLIYFGFNGFPYQSLIVLGVVTIIYFVLIMFVKKWKNGIGFGDFLIFLFFALTLSLEQFVSLFVIYSYITGIYAIFLVIKNRKDLKIYIPQVPFLTLAYILSFVLTNTIVSFLGI